MRQLLLTILFLWANSNLCFGQDTLDIRKKLKTGLTKHLQSCFANNPQSKNLVKKISEWTTIEKNEDELTNLLYQIMYSRRISDLKPKRVLKVMKSNYTNSPLPHILTEEDVTLISQCDCIVLMISHEYVTISNPTTINIQNVDVEKFSFFDIRESDTVLELGAGMGMNALTTSIATPSKKLYVNELDHNLVDYLSSMLDTTSQSIKIVTGKKKETGIPDQVDKIIAINTYHHFKSKKKMLQSIKRNLKEDGYLIFLERLKNPTEKDGCKLAMTRTKIISDLKAGGFKLIENKIIGDLEGFKFRHI